jgi:hypothetical protein
VANDIKSIFSQEGHGRHSYLLVNNSRDWAIIPAGTLKGFAQTLPIRLQVGTKAWGKLHIEFAHGNWLKKIGKTVEEALYTKLSQSGTVFTTESEDKIKIIMRLPPDAILVLRYTKHSEGDFFTVVTLYLKNNKVDGEAIGRYLSSFSVF